MTVPEHILTFLCSLRRRRNSIYKKIIPDAILRGWFKKRIFGNFDTFWPLKKTDQDNLFTNFFLRFGILTFCRFQNMFCFFSKDEKCWFCHSFPKGVQKRFFGPQFSKKNYKMQNMHVTKT